MTQPKTLKKEVRDYIDAKVIVWRALQKSYGEDKIIGEELRYQIQADTLEALLVDIKQLS